MNIFGLSAGLVKKFKNISISNENTIGLNLTDAGYNNLYGRTNYYNQGQAKWVYYLKKINGTDSIFSTDFINVYSLSSWINIDLNYKHIVSHNFFGLSKDLIINDTYKNKEIVSKSKFSRNTLQWMLGTSVSVNIFKYISIEPEIVYYYYSDPDIAQPFWYETFWGDSFIVPVYFLKYELISGISLKIRI